MSATKKNINNISQSSSNSLHEGNLEKHTQVVTKISPLFILQGENVIEKSTPLNEVMKGKASAATFAVIENSKVDCVGVVGKQSDNPTSLEVTTNTMFLIASMTKTVIAYCTTQCLQEYVFTPLKMESSTISQSPRTLEKLDGQLAYWAKTNSTMNRRH